jgi:predicted enzyme related to lactoylglutathione lyase
VTMGRYLRFGHAALYARDRKRLQAFYQTIFEMKMLTGDERPEISQLAFDPEASVHDLSVVGHPNQVQMTFYADSLVHLQSFRQKVRAAGIPAAELTVRPQGVSFHFCDPEGNRIELMCLSGER